MKTKIKICATDFIIFIKVLKDQYGITDYKNWDVEQRIEGKNLIAEPINKITGFRIKKLSTT